MAYRILSNFSSAKSNKLISKFSKESSSRVFSTVLKEQQNYVNELKLVVSRLHRGLNSHLISLLSIGEKNDNFANFSRQHRSDSLFPVASCNDKILLNGSNDYELAALWNPTTGEINTLPRPGTRFELDYILYGLGFVPKTKHNYKVVRVIKNVSEVRVIKSLPDYDIYEQDDGDFEVELYSQKTDSWEWFAACPAGKVTPAHGPSLFINGSYYWPAFKSGNRASSVILRFDFANEKLSIDIPLPDGICNFILAEFEGSLAVVAYSSLVSKPFELEIWVWNEETKTWARRGDEWAAIVSVPGGVKRLLGLFNNDQLYLLDSMGELLLFHCGTRELKNLGLKSDPPGRFDFGPMMHIFAYVQNLEEEEVKHRENERKMKRCVGTLINSTTFKSKLAPINVIDDSKQKPNNNNKQKLMFCHDFEGTLYLSDNSLKEEDISSDVLFNFPALGAKFLPTASCNSALLLCCEDFDRGARAAFWNPTTDEVKKLPDRQLSSPYRIVENVWYGFGFDPKADDEGDYKVIRFLPVINENMPNAPITIKTDLYSLKTDSWKDLATPFSYDELFIQPSLYVNGFCYWVAGDYEGCILSFDFANENFSSAPHIPLPIPNFFSEKTFLLTQFHGSLAALVYANTDEEHSSYELQNKKTLEILELWVWNKDESSSWTRESVIHLPVGVEKPLGLFGNDQLYLQGSNGEILIFDCAKGGELKSLNPSLRSTMENWGETIGRQRSENDICRDYIFPYVESSFPLNGKKIIRASHKIIGD